MREPTAVEQKAAVSLARRISRDLHKRTDAAIRVSVDAARTEKNHILLTVAFPYYEREAATAAVEAWGVENPHAKVGGVEGSTRVSVTMPYQEELA